MEDENNGDPFPETTMKNQRVAASAKFYQEQRQANKEFQERMQSVYLLIMTCKQNPLPAEVWQIINKFERASFTAYWYTKQDMFMQHWDDKLEKVKKKNSSL